MSKAPCVTPSPSSGHAPTLANRRLGLTPRYRRRCSTTEIVHVDLTPRPTASSSSELDALAVYADPLTNHSWVDVFGLDSQRSHIKAPGSHAVLAPLTAGGPRRLASLPCAGEARRATSLVVRESVKGKTVVEIKQATAAPLAWSRHGTALVAGEARGRLGVWDARSGARIGRVVGHIEQITHAAFMPDDSLVTLSRDGTARITDPQTARTLAKLGVDGPSGANPRVLAVSPDGDRVVSVWGTTVHVWLPRAGRLDTYGLNIARASEGWPLCISPDCRWMACRTEAGFDVVDLADGRVVWDAGPRDAIYTDAAFSTDAEVLVLGSMDGVVEVWDVDAPPS